MHTKEWKKPVARGRKKKSLFLKDISLSVVIRTDTFSVGSKSVSKKKTVTLVKQTLLYFIIAYSSCEIGCRAEDSSFLLNFTSK